MEDMDTILFHRLNSFFFSISDNELNRNEFMGPESNLDASENETGV